jgi:hypothetical protein
MPYAGCGASRLSGGDSFEVQTNLVPSIPIIKTAEAWTNGAAGLAGMTLRYSQHLEKSFRVRWVALPERERE